MKCARCDCDEKAHCKGNVVHVGHYKSDREYVVTCVSRHCLNPMCSCVDFIEPGQPIPKLWPPPELLAAAD